MVLFWRATDAPASRPPCCDEPVWCQWVGVRGHPLSERDRLVRGCPRSRRGPGRRAGCRARGSSGSRQRPGAEGTLPPPPRRGRRWRRRRPQPAQKGEHLLAECVLERRLVGRVAAEDFTDPLGLGLDAAFTAGSLECAGDLPVRELGRLGRIERSPCGGLTPRTNEWSRQGVLTLDGAGHRRSARRRRGR